jgi:uncharacterized glyoxalase superfamily protein PhnB
VTAIRSNIIPAVRYRDADAGLQFLESAFDAEAKEVVDDPDAHHERAVAAGATVVRPLEDMEYGSREYSVRDPEGNLWSFGTYDPYDAG